MPIRSRKNHSTYRLYLSGYISFVLIFLFFAPGLYGNRVEVPGEWKVGVSRIEITPEKAMRMSGYTSRVQPAEEAVHSLWAKALTFEDTKGNQAVLITTDLVGIPKYVSDSIRNQLEKRYSLSRAQIILSSSHTHTGPVLKDPTDVVYFFTPEEVETIKDYTGTLINKIIDLVGESLKSKEPARVYASNGIARFQVNRRNNNERELTGQTVLNGPNDYAVPVLKVENKDGTIKAIAFGYACHATTIGITKWSGDYPGFAQIELEKAHPGITALFFQGAGGDLNPLPRGKISFAKQYGKTLAASVEKVLDEEMRELPSQLSTAYADLNLSFAALPTKGELMEIVEKESGWEKQWASRYLDILEKEKKINNTYPYPVQVWQLGDQMIASIGGEPVVDYAISLKRIFGEDIFVLGYCNDVMGYIPSVRVLREGGYEGFSSQMSYGLPAAWMADIEVRIIGQVVELAKKVN
ncbi:neutral/alkaline non-lysosomal ceramidase N-terminal domain-containing protein, partial [Bacteroidota bacterium]